MAHLLKCPAAYSAAQVDDDLILLDVSKGTFFVLAGVGLAVWDALDEDADLDSICTRFVAEYDVSPEQCARDVSEFAGELVERGFARFA